MVFGKLSSQLTGNKKSKEKGNGTGQRRRSGAGSVISSVQSSSSAKSADMSGNEFSKAPSSSTTTNPPGRSAAAPAEKNNSSFASPSAVVPLVHGAAGNASSAPVTISGPGSVSPAGLGRGRGTNSCIRGDRQNKHQIGSPENPLIDDLLAELEGSPSEAPFQSPNKASRLPPPRKNNNNNGAGGAGATVSPAGGVKKSNGAGAGKVNNSNDVTVSRDAPAGLNIAELTRGSSFDGFDAQGFASRRSSDASPSMSRGAFPGAKESFDTVATASQHFVHVLRLNDMDGYFSVAENSKDDEVRKALSKKSPQEVQSLVVALMDILEEVRVARGRIGAMRGSFSHLEAAEKRAMSASMFSTMSTASLARPPVHETTRVAMAYDRQGNRMINRYTVLADLGQGAYGKVKLGREGDSGDQVAIKIIDKKHLKKKLGGPGANSDNALRREIAIMKKVRHRNCVSLYEVIDDPASNKLYLIMDYVPNGPVVRLKHQNLMPFLLRAAEGRRVVNGVMYNLRALRFCARNRLSDIDVPFSDEEINSQPSCFCCHPLRQSVCALYLRQLVSGLRYMHKRNVVHHDIKPDNILLGVDHHVYLTDFGVSEILQKEPEPDPTKSGGQDEDSETGSSMLGAARGGGGARLGGGTLLFTAPELLDPDVDKATVDPYATDVWALGVTLYCMLFGFAPFAGGTYGEVVRNIRESPFFWSESSLTGTPILAEWRTVLSGMLEKSPSARWTLVKLKEYLDFPAFHLALQTSELEESIGTDGELATSLSFGKPQSYLNSPPVPPSADRASPAGAVALSPGSASTGVANAFPSITRISSISTSHLHSFSSSLRPISDSNAALTPSAACIASPASGQMGSGGVNQNKYMPWDIGVSEQDVRDACLTVQVDMVKADKHAVSDHTRAMLNRYVQHIRARVRPQQRLFSATPRLKRTSSQMKAELDAEFGSAGDNFDDILTDTEDDPLGAQHGLGNQWHKVRPIATREAVPDQEGSSRSSEVPLVPVAGTFHRVAGNSASSSSSRGSPGPRSGNTSTRTAPNTTNNTNSLATSAGAPPQGGRGISVNPNVNTRPMSRRRVSRGAAHALFCGSQSLDAMLSMVELQSEGVSAGSETNTTDHDDYDDDEDVEAMGPRAFTRTRLPSEGTDKPREKAFLSISHGTPDGSILDCAAATQKHQDENGEGRRGSHNFSNVRTPSVSDLRKAVEATASEGRRGPSPSAAPSSTSDGEGSQTAANATAAAVQSSRPSISCSPRASTRKPVAVQKLASTSAPGPLPCSTRGAYGSVDTKKQMLMDNDAQVQRQLSGGKGRRAVTRDSSASDLTSVEVDLKSSSSSPPGSSASPVLTAWERKVRR